MSDVDSVLVARMLRAIAKALELLGESKFRAQAFSRGADSVEALGPRLHELTAAQRLTDVPGIGPALAAQITEIGASGTSTYLTRLEEKLPAGALALAAVPGLTLPTIRKLSDAGVRDRDGLLAALDTGSLAGIKGFGPKTLQRLRGHLERPAPPASTGRPLADALDAAEWLGDALRTSGTVARVELAGDARRECEVVHDVTLVAAATDPEAARAAVARIARLGPVEIRDDAAYGRLAQGLPVAVHVTTEERFAVSWQRQTGSLEHNQALEHAALQLGLRFESAGLYRGTELLPIASERALYAALGVAWVPPPLREEGEPLRQPGTERKLLQREDLRGLVHCHTNYSDGRASIEDMARAAQSRGMQYLTITDHSPTASYAGGVEIDRLKRQWDEIAAVQERVQIRLLRGTESDILRDGALDYPDKILERLDVIIASIHNRYQLDRAAMTARIVRAMRHPLFKIWGHALGRILERRPPVDCDHDAVLDAVASSRAAIELNGDPWRMDMPPRMAKRARALGVKFVVSVDAHSVANYDNVSFGVGMAQRAGLSREDVLNTLSAEAFVRAVRPLPG